MPVFCLNENEISFPDPTLARSDGLLAVGGDLCVERLLLAYTHGIFPWYNPGEEILWWCPKDRFVIFPKEIHVSRSMKKYMKKHELKIMLNRDFADTMHRCRIKREFAEEPGSRMKWKLHTAVCIRLGTHLAWRCLRTMCLRADFTVLRLADAFLEKVCSQKKKTGRKPR